MMIATERKFSKVLEIVDRLFTFVEKAASEGVRVDQVERHAFDELLGMGLKLLEAYFELSGDGDVGETVERNGQLLKRLEDSHSSVYRSIFGVLSVDRCVYAVRKGQKHYAPLDEQVSLPDGEQSYVLEDWLQRFCVQNAFDSGVQSLNDLLGTNTGKRSAERINQKLSEYVEPFRASQNEVLEDEEELLVVTADGKGVPMRHTLEERMNLPELPWRRCQRKKQEKKAGERASHRLSRGQTKVGKQMAYVGAVYSIARWSRTVEDIAGELLRNESSSNRPRPRNKRVRAEMTRYHEGERWEGMPRLFADLASQIDQRDPDKQKILVCIMDGQKSLWGYQRDELSRAVCIVDIFHVIERLWTATYFFHRQGSREAEKLVTRYLRMLLEGKVKYVIGSLRRRAAKLTESKQEELAKHLTYLSNNSQYMKYDEYIEQGYPIGSGVVEGACRHLVRDRMERTGMRWEIEGAQAMLNTRSAFINDEWDDLIEYRIRTEQECLYGQAG